MTPKEFKLPRADIMATTHVLGPSDLPDVLELQDRTRAALPDAQKMFVLPQSEDYFRDLLGQKNGTMIGIRAAGQLLSQMAVMGAMTVEEMADRQKLTRNDISLHHAAPSDFVVIAKSMAVHPEFRGNELSQHMLEMMQSLPLTRRTDHVFAQISVDNLRSWELFLRQGFGIVAAAVDPLDYKPRFVMQKPALGFALNAMASADMLDPIADFPAIMRLTQREALIGQMDEGVGFKLAFHASADMAAAWGDTAYDSA